MRIAQLAPLWLTIPPENFGGTERVIANLNKGYVNLGHEVTLFACKGSTIEGGKVVEVIDQPMNEILNGFKWVSMGYGTGQFLLFCWSCMEFCVEKISFGGIRTGFSDGEGRDGGIGGEIGASSWWRDQL